MHPQDPDAVAREAPVRRIAGAVEARRDGLVAFVQALVRTQSVTGDEGELQAIVETHLRAAALETDVWEPDPAELAPYADHARSVTTLAGRPNVVGILRGTAGGRSLILNGHIDTVESGDPAC